MSTPTREPLLDRLLDRSIVGGNSLIGLGVRRRLPGWPTDPHHEALAGRQVMVTGASSGIGHAMAGQMVRLGGHVHLVVRDEAKGARVAREIDPGGRRTTVWRCDLADPDQVATLARDVVDDGVVLHGLVHNAGTMPQERTESVDGHEMTMALHVIRPIDLTERLLPALRGQLARVVLMSSSGMYGQALPVDDPDYRDGSYSALTAYARSKRTQVELLGGLQRRWACSGVALYAAHPGWVDTPGIRQWLPRFSTVTGPVLRSPDQGADTTTWLIATTPRMPRGGLWHDRRERPTTYLGRNGSTDADRSRMLDWACAAAGVRR